jgi:tetratricopeptide (TPR) repeat protein
MTIHSCITSFTLIIAAVTAACASAQSMQVFGGAQSAKNCYMAATVAAQSHYASAEDIKECTYALEQTSLRPRDKVATLVNRGILYNALEEYDKAIRDYDKAYKISPNIAEIHINRGNMLFMSQFFDRAVEEYTKALELEFSKQHVAFYNRGLAYEKMGDASKAEADYRRALELMPEWSRAKTKLERLLNKTKKS